MATPSGTIFRFIPQGIRGIPEQREPEPPNFGQIKLENERLKEHIKIGMSAIERTIQVSYRHQVHFTQGVFSADNRALRDVLVNDREERLRKALVIIDESLALSQPGLAREIECYFATYSDCLKLVCPPVVLEGGERAKNSYFHVSEIHSEVEKYHIDRHSYIIAVGGGALLDVVGLAAATAHRGVRHVRIPTTTLSQDDSGVGVKNGINAFGKKNFIGTFAPPFAVINDFQLLHSLPARDKRAGYVEAVKVALIRDGIFFNAIENDAEALAQFEPAAMQRLIYRSAELHLNHIATSGDPFEFGSARPLDFGHWAAHKLEQLSDYKLRHGEAVAIGIALDVIYARRIGLLDTASSERVINLLEKLGFELFANELLNIDAEHNLLVLTGLEEFREHLGGELTITLLKSVGEGVEVHAMNLPKVIEAIYELHERHNRRTHSVVHVHGAS
ncbi:MAG: aroB [Verrucomicrobiales bacterium]|nr:aroB [Verrucomicrobiales bacterium]